MIKVLSLVSYQFLPPRMGGQKAIALFYKYFTKQVDLSIVTTQNNDPALAEGYELLNILSNSATRYLNVFYFFTLRRIIRQKKITHLILEHPYYGWLGLLLKWFTGKQSTNGGGKSYGITSVSFIAQRRIVFSSRNRTGNMPSGNLD
jgi:hypothetical protein